MVKRKICVTTGTRAEYGLLKPLLYEISKSKKLDLFLVVTGMHLSKKHGLSIQEIKKDGFNVYAKIKMIPEGNDAFFMTKSLGDGILSFSKVLKKLKPDFNLVLGDRDEALASALTASHMNIPNVHIHGGDKSKAGIDEYNRHAITKLSNIHFAATKKSKSRIIKLGENRKYVYFSGSPGIDDVLKKKFTSKLDLEKKYKINFSGNDILFLQHPVTTQIEKSESQILNSLNAIVKTKQNTIIIAPNSDAGNFPIFKQLELYSKKFNFLKMYANVPRIDYLGFLNNCAILLGNSSSGIIEAGYFDIQVINVGIRQKGREQARNVINIQNASSKKIFNELNKIINQKKRKFKKSNLYGKGNISKFITRKLETIEINDDLIQKQITY